MTATDRSTLWLVSLPDQTARALADRLARASGLRAVTLVTAEEAIARLDQEVPALVVVDGNLGETERFALYCQVASAASGDEVPFVLVDGDTSEPRVRLEGEADQPIGDRATASSLTDAVWGSVTLMTRTSDQVAPQVKEPPTHYDEPAAVAMLPARIAESYPPQLAAVPAELPSAFTQIMAALGRRWWLALAILVTVMVADIFYTVSRQPTYLARASLIISPSANVDRENLVYSVDSLGRGRIVGTYAEVLGSELVHREALERLGYPPSALESLVMFKSSTVADTAVVQVTAESPNPALSADAANLAGEVGIERMTGLFPVYNLVFLSRATPPTVPYRPDPVRNYSIGLLIGLVLAIVVAYAVDTAAHKMRATQTTRREAKSQEPAPAAVNESQMKPVSTAKKSWLGGRSRTKTAVKPDPVATGPSVEHGRLSAAATVLVPAVDATPTAVDTAGAPSADGAPLADAPAADVAPSPPAVANGVVSRPTIVEPTLSTGPADGDTATAEPTLSSPVAEQDRIPTETVSAPVEVNGLANATKGSGLFKGFGAKNDKQMLSQPSDNTPPTIDAQPAKQRRSWFSGFGKRKAATPEPATVIETPAPTAPRESPSQRLERVLSGTAAGAPGGKSDRHDTGGVPDHKSRSAV